MSKPEPSFRLVEAFTSIQGESTHAGRQCLFLRFAGCNLRCSFCDTGYALKPDDGESKTLSELLAIALAAPVRLVELTGGEPLLQKEMPLLAQTLIQHGFEVLLETNGSCPIHSLPTEMRKILDCKPPSSGMAHHNLAANYPLLQPHDEVKFLIGNRADFDHALAVIRKHRLTERTANLIVSPVWDTVPFAQLAEWVLHAEIPELRMQLQLHKFIWPPDQRGV